MARVLLVDNGVVQEYPLSQELTIGRAYSNLLRLEGDEISRVHAIIYRRGDDYIVRDLDSKNGVYLNNMKVANAMLGPGDEIQLGKYTLLFDPPEHFDMKAFLRQHNQNVTSEEQPAPEPDAEVTSTSRDHSVQFAAGSAQVFFNVPEIDNLRDTQNGALSPYLLSDMMRMLNRIAPLPMSDDTEDENAAFQVLLAAAISGVTAERGVIVLRDEHPEGESLRLAAIMPRDRDVSVNSVVLRSVFRSTQAVLCNDTMHDERFQKTSTVLKERIGSLIAYPIIRADSTVAGLVYCDVTERKNCFRHEHLLLMHYISRMAALLLRNMEVRHS